MTNKEVKVAPNMPNGHVAGIHVSNNPRSKNRDSVGLGCNGKANVESTSNNARKGRRVRTKTKGQGGGTNGRDRGPNGSNSGGVDGSKGGSTSSTKVFYTKEGFGSCDFKIWSRLGVCYMYVFRWGL